VSATEDGTDVGGEIPLDDSSLYFNRELSWLLFNERVLELAEEDTHPLLERVKFLAISTTNLDEFFMIRVAGLHDQEAAGVEGKTADGLGPAETLAGVRRMVSDLATRQARLWRAELRPQLAQNGIRIVPLAALPARARREASDRFRSAIFPVLTPLAVGPGRPFPYISNLSLSLAVSLRDPDGGHEVFARVKVPVENLGRFLAVTDGEGGEEYHVPVEDVIAQHLEDLFPHMEIVDQAAFRVTRDADFEVSDEADDLIRAVESELRRRRLGEVVRVEVAADMRPGLRSQLVAALGVEERDVYEADELVDFGDVMQLASLRGHQALRDAPWTGQARPAFVGEDDEPADVFEAMRKGDLLVHHPYDSFSASVVRFVQQAVSDPDVLAIKQTVYRTSDDSPLVPALIAARERDKQAVCLVELKARFDERANIAWARRLEEAGVHVTYGAPGLKTHVKAVLIVRREGDGVRRYVHIGTGNYHPKTARLYTDFGLFTCDEDIASDVAEMFNALTGYGRPAPSRKVLLAPTDLRDGIIARIERVIAAHTAEEPARIAMKMNAIVDPACIRALYRASQAGVRVDLNIRGICCLRPGVSGVSENIRVVSVVGRFLEHSRAFAFTANGETELLIGSADLMPRNLDTRVELVAPVGDPDLRDEILDVIDRCLADNVNGWDLAEDGTWTRRETPEDPAGVHSVHADMMRLALERAGDG
jgi:polyphosphate kinase